MTRALDFLASLSTKRETYLNLIISKVKADLTSVNHESEKPRMIYTFFGKGIIVELATRWVRALSFQPRYSPLSVNQYTHNLKDSLLRLSRCECYQNLSLDLVLLTVTRRDLQEWMLQRKAMGVQSSTLRNRETPVKLFLEWLTTQEAGRVRTLKNKPYKTGKLISPAPHR